MNEIGAFLDFFFFLLHQVNQ